MKRFLIIVGFILGITACSFTQSSTDSSISRIQSRSRSVGSLLSLSEFKQKLCLTWYQDGAHCNTLLTQIPLTRQVLEAFFGQLVVSKGKVIHQNGELSKVSSFLHQGSAKSFAGLVARDACASGESNTLLPEVLDSVLSLCQEKLEGTKQRLASLYEQVIGLEFEESERDWFASSFSDPKLLGVEPGKTHLEAVIYGLTYNPYFILSL